MKEENEMEFFSHAEKKNSTQTNNIHQNLM